MILVSLPLINYETIKYNYEFKYSLRDRYPILFSWLDTTKSDIAQIPPKELRQILKLYKQFVEEKENWFQTNRISSKKSPVIPRETLKAWLEHGIKFVTPAPNFLSKFLFKAMVKYNRPKEVIRKKAVERLLPVLEHIAKETPTIMNILVYNTRPKFFIYPSSMEKLIGSSEGEAGALICTSRNITLKEDELFDDKEKPSIKRTECIIRHEFYHLIDFAAINVDAPTKRLPYYRKSFIGYSSILNERLNGRLYEIAKKESERTRKFLEDKSRLGNSLSNRSFSSKLEINELIEKEINELIKKHKIWQRVFPRVVIESDSGKVSFWTEGLDPTPETEELFARMLEAYFYNKDILKAYNPEIYEIVEKEILPDLR